MARERAAPGTQKTACDVTAFACYGGCVLRQKLPPADHSLEDRLQQWQQTCGSVVGVCDSSFHGLRCSSGQAAVTGVCADGFWCGCVLPAFPVQLRAIKLPEKKRSGPREMPVGKSFVV